MDEVTGCQCLECEELAYLFRNQTWKELSGGPLESLLGKSYLLTDETFAYILPAGMVVSLTNPEESTWIIDRIITTYVFSGFPTRTISPLNPDQRIVFLEWFEWAIAGVEQEWRGYIAENSYSILEAEGEEWISTLQSWLKKWRSTPRCLLSVDNGCLGSTLSEASSVASLLS